MTPTSQNFYSECIDEFHNAAREMGYADKGQIRIAALNPVGTKIVIDLLNSKAIQDRFSQDTQTYYYVILMLTMQSGMVVSNRWHQDEKEPVNNYLNELVSAGISKQAEELWMENFDVDVKKSGTIYVEIFRRWNSKMESHWDDQDPRDSIFNSLVAVFQLGVSIILDKLEQE